MSLKYKVMYIDVWDMKRNAKAYSIISINLSYASEERLRGGTDYGKY